MFCVCVGKSRAKFRLCICVCVMCVCASGESDFRRQRQPNTHSPNIIYNSSSYMHVKENASGRIVGGGTTHTHTCTFRLQARVDGIGDGLSGMLSRPPVPFCDADAMGRGWMAGWFGGGIFERALHTQRARRIGRVHKEIGSNVQSMRSHPTTQPCEHIHHMHIMSRRRVWFWVFG